MNDKMKSCFTPHAMMHSLIGLGLGFLLAHFWSVLATNLWIGVVVLAVGVVLDLARKS